MSRTDRPNRTTLLLVGWLVGDLAAGALGYATGGADGGAIAAIAFALAVGAVGGLLSAVGAAVGRPARTSVRSGVGGAVAVAGWTVLGASVPEPALPLWVLYGVVALVGVLLGATCESPTSGLWHGVAACGAGGVLTVYLSVYESFTMRPELGGFVVIAAVVAPLTFGVAGGVGSGVGALASDAVGTVRVSE